MSGKNEQVNYEQRCVMAGCELWLGCELKGLISW